MLAFLKRDLLAGHSLRLRSLSTQHCWYWITLNLLQWFIFGYFCIAIRSFKHRSKQCEVSIMEHESRKSRMAYQCRYIYHYWVYCYPVAFVSLFSLDDVLGVNNSSGKKLFWVFASFGTTGYSFLIFFLNLKEWKHDERWLLQIAIICITALSFAVLFIANLFGGGASYSDCIEVGRFSELKCYWKYKKLQWMTCDTARPKDIICIPNGITSDLRATLEGLYWWM